MSLGQGILTGVGRDRVVIGELLLVAPLIGVDVVPARSVLKAGGAVPILAEGQSTPGLHGSQLLLADVVGQAAAVDADAAGQHQGVNARAVHEVGMVPVVDPRADDDGALAARHLCGHRPLAREFNEVVAAEARVLLAPSGGVGGVLVVVILGVLPPKPAAHAVLRHEQVVTRGHRDLAAVGGLQEFHRHFPVDA